MRDPIAGEAPQLLATIRVPATRQRSFRSTFQRHWMLYAMLIPAFIALLLFNIFPLWGIAIAFVDFNPFKGLSGSRFVGMKYFAAMVQDPDAWPLLRNTLFIAINKIVWGQLIAVVFALMLFEVKLPWFRRSVQTLTTLPNFLSWVIVGGVLAQLLSGSGMVNQVLVALGMSKIEFLTSTSVFPWTLIFSDIWKGFGFGAIIYLAALTAVSPELHEAAAIDGAGRWQRLWNITLPAITPTIVLLSCLSLSGVLNAGFDQIIILQNPLVFATGDVIDTMVFRLALQGDSYSLATAIGLLKSVVSFFLITGSWWLASRYANYRIF